MALSLLTPNSYGLKMESGGSTTRDIAVVARSKKLARLVVKNSSFTRQPLTVVGSARVSAQLKRHAPLVPAHFPVAGRAEEELMLAATSLCGGPTTQRYGGRNASTSPSIVSSWSKLSIARLQQQSAYIIGTGSRTTTARRTWSYGSLVIRLASGLRRPSIVRRVCVRALSYEAVT